MAGRAPPGSGYQSAGGNPSGVMTTSVVVDPAVEEACLSCKRFSGVVGTAARSVHAEPIPIPGSLRPPLGRAVLLGDAPLELTR
jgi:hypothetical protein